MTNEQIDALLEADNLEVLEAHSNIIETQKNKNNLLKLGVDWLDASLIGGANNKLLFFGSRPGGGKTYMCSRLIKNLLNKQTNPNPIKVLRCNLEMPTEALLLRQLSKDLNKKPSEILRDEYTEAEKIKALEVVNTFKDPRIQNISIALEGDSYKYLLTKFLKEIDEKDFDLNLENYNIFIKNGGKKEDFKPVKTKKVVLTDHIHVYLSKTTIDTILTIQNQFKMIDKNLSFLNFFQLNRETEDMWLETKEKKVNPKNMLPTSKAIYLTDMLQMYADLVVGLVIPQTYELDEFASVNKERNQHLKEHFLDENPENKSSRLKGRNRIYYNLIKVRMLDDFDDPKLFCEILNPAYEEKAEKLYRESKQTPFPSNTSFQTMPSFNSTIPIADSTPDLSKFEPSFNDLKDPKNSPF